MYKNNFIYKLAKKIYLDYIHFRCDRVRKPLFKPLKDKLLNLNFGGG